MRRSDGRGSVITGQIVTEAKLIRARELRRAMTDEERMLWNRLRAARLGAVRFRRQQIIDGFIADFYCHAVQLVIEVDGAAHRDDMAYDAARDQIIAARGLRVLRVTNDEVRRDHPAVVTRIARLIARLSEKPVDDPFDGSDDGDSVAPLPLRGGAGGEVS